MKSYAPPATRPAPARRVALYLLPVLLALLTTGACTSSDDASPAAGTDSLASATPGGSSGGRGDDDSTASPEAPALRLATFNAEFLFDGRGKEGRVDFARSGDPQAARAHLDRVGQIIRDLDADAVMLQEVENEGVLQQLVDGPLAGMGYTAHFVQGTDYFTEQDIGLLSRLSVERTGRTDERAPVGGARDDDYGVSKNLWARLDWDGVPVTLIGVHFLARPDDASRRDQREAQAEVIRRLVVQEQSAGRAPVVLGDFNDFDVETPDRIGSRPITGVLQTVKRAGPGPADNLRSVMARAPQEERYTSFYDRNRDDQVDPASEYSAIDHMLLAPALYDRLKAVRYVHEHDPVQGPDHFPIVATFAAGQAMSGESAGSEASR